MPTDIICHWLQTSSIQNPHPHGNRLSPDFPTTEGIIQNVAPNTANQFLGDENGWMNSSSCIPAPGSDHTVESGDLPRFEQVEDLGRHTSRSYGYSEESIGQRESYSDSKGGSHAMNRTKGESNGLDHRGTVHDRKAMGISYQTKTKTIYVCTFQNCKKEFGRIYELHRHHRGAHAASWVFTCRHSLCPRGARGFPRKDKRDDHERKVHGRVLA